MADEIARGSIIIDGDASGVVAEIANVERRLDNLGQSATTSGRKAAAGINQIGDGADTSARKTEVATRSLIGSIQRATAAMEAGSKTSAKYYETLAQQRGVDVNALRPYLDQLDAVSGKMKQTGISAGQMQAALRGVPAQFTDIATSLASGQAPLTVLLQQGGQLKDMFGGIGPAAKALGGYLLGLINPTTLAVAAIAGIGYAMYKGAEQQREFQNALTLTGNAAGVTAAQMDSMRERVAMATGEWGMASDAVLELVKSGKVAGAELEKVALATVRWAKATGQSVADVAKEYAAIAKDPVKAAQELSEKYGYLTASTYYQVAALEKLGQTQEAAILLQRKHAEESDKTAKKVVENIGWIDQLWKDIKTGAGMAYNAVNGWGKSSTSDDEASKLRQQIAALEQSRAPGNPFGGWSNEKQRQLDLLKKQLSQQEALIEAEHQQAEAEAKAREERELSVKAAQALTEAARAAMLPEEQRLEAVRKLRLEYERATSAAAGLNEEQRAKATTDYAVAVRAAEARNQPRVDNDRLLDALAQVESGGRQFDRNGKTVTSGSGALGMYQIMPSSGPDLARLAGVQWSEARLRQDAGYGRQLASAYISHLMTIFDGDTEKALTAYHSGQGTVGKAIADAGIGGDWKSKLGPNGQAYANLVLGQFTRDAGGNYAGGPKLNAEAIDEQREILKMQDEARASLASLEAQQQGYNKTMADFIGLKATNAWKEMSPAMQQAKEKEAIAGSTLEILSQSYDKHRAAALSAAAAEQEYNTASIGAAAGTRELAQAQAEFDRLKATESWKILSKETKTTVEQLFAADQMQRQVDASFRNAAGLKLQAQQLEEANKYYGQSTILIGERKKALMEEALAEALANGASDKRIKSLQAEIEQQGKVNDAMRQAEYNKMVDGYQERLRAAQDLVQSSAAELELASLYGVERAKAVALLEAELRIKKDVAAIDRAGLVGEQRANAIQEATAAAMAEANAKVAKAAVDEWSKTADQINQSLTDALMRGFESGKDFAKNFRDTLKNMFQTLVLRPVIQAVMAPVAGGIAGMVPGSVQAGSLGGSGGGLDFTTVLGLGKNAYNWGSGTLSGGTAATATYSYGSESAGWAAMQNGADSSLLASQGAGSSGVSSGASSASGWVSAGSTLIGSMAGNYAASKWGKQTPSGQRAGSYGASGGAAAGAYYGSSFGPWGTLIGAVAGGVLGAVGASQLFGHGGEKSGGNYNASYSASGQLTQDQFFGGYTPNQADSDLKQYVQGVKDSYQSLATMLGGDAKALTINLGYDTDPQGTAGNRVSAQLAMYQQPVGLDNTAAEKTLQANSLLDWRSVSADNLQEKLTEATVRMLLLALQNSNIDEEYRKVLDGKDIAKMSEAEVESLTQQLQYRKQLNDAFKDLGKVMPQLSVMAFDMKDQFVGLFGGMQNLTAALGDYYQNFYSDAERKAVTQQHIAESLSEVNLTLPKTRSEFRHMVEGLDLTTDAGQKAYTVMMQVSGAFASVSEAVSSFDSDWSGLLDQATSAQQDLLREQLDGYTSARDAAKSAADSIRGMLDSLKLGDLSTLSPEQKLAEARRQFDDALGKARSGDMVAAGNLSGLGQTLLEQSRNYNASGAGYVGDYNRVTDALQSVGAVAQTTADAAQRQIDLLNGQLNVQTSAAKSLDKIVTQMADLIFNTGKMGDLASLLSGLPPGIANPIVSAVNAMAASTISGAYQQYLGRAPDKGGADYYTDQLKGGATPSTVVDAIKNSAEAQLQAAYQSALGRTADSAGLSWYMGAIADGSKTLEQALADIKYAGVNGSHANGLPYVPFDGYIAELHRGERVLTAEETRRYSTSQRAMVAPVDYSRMGRGDGLTQALIQRVEQMTEELRQLRAERREGDQMAARQRNDQARQQQELAQQQQRGIARLAADSL